MQNRWYGDNRDLVKWGTLIHLAGDDPGVKILQVLMMRPDCGRDSRLVERGPHGVQKFEISESVFDHFRCVQNIASLDGRIITHADPFPKNSCTRPQNRRAEYFGAVCGRIGRLQRQRLLVLADPDNGINARNPQGVHISPGELSQLYHALNGGDTLVLYQHRQLYRKDWLGRTLSLFAKATRDEVRVFQCRELAPDVALFAVDKS